MKNVFVSLMLLSMCLVSRTGMAEEALLWCFNDPGIATLSGESGQAGAVVGPDGKTVNAIRMKAVDGDTSSYLSLYAVDHGVLTSLGSALLLPGEGGTWTLDPLFAGLGSGYDKAGVQFIIELGAYYNDDWTALAYSQLADISELRESGSIQLMSTTAVPAESAWDGGAYSIPEPSGAMLLLLGGALLSLRRKRHV